MDAVKGERRKPAAAAAAAAAAPADDAAPRRPLAPSEKNNAAAAPAGRRPSRFKPVAPPAPDAAAARRCASPVPGRAAAVDGPATCNSRARSADRARPAPLSAATPSSRLKSSPAATPRSATPPRDAAAEARGTRTPPRARNARVSDGPWASARSSSPSPRPEPVAAPAGKIDRLVRGLPSEQTNKSRPGAASSERKRSPLRGATNGIGDQRENARPSESPAMRLVEQHRWPAMTNGRRGSAGLLSTSAAPAEKSSRSVSSSDASAGCSPRKVRARPSDGAGKCLKPSSNEMAKRVPVHRRRRRDHRADSSSDTSSETSEGSKSAGRPSRATSSPVTVLHRASSPRQGLPAASFTSRSCQSPSRMRPSGTCRSKCASSAVQPGAEQPVFNYIFDARKGKKNAGQIENVHQLRLLYNIYMQWRFVNARSEDAISQKKSVESILYSVWKSIMTLRDALTITRIDVQHLQEEQKMHNILTEQISYLQQWPVLEEESSSTLIGAIEALKASTLRLPVTSGAQADGVAVRNAISSAVDVMQALSSSICYLQPKVEGSTSLVSELSVMTREEKVALDQCRELLATAVKLQVQETSLRTHLMQSREKFEGR